MNAHPVRIGTHRVTQIGGTRNGRQPDKPSTFLPRFNTGNDLGSTLRREHQSRTIGRITAKLLPWLIAASLCVFALRGVVLFAAWVRL